MIPSEIIIFSVLALTILSGAAATAVALAGNPRSSAQRKLVERLSRVTLIGAAAVFALLSRIGGG